MKNLLLIIILSSSTIEIYSQDNWQFSISAGIRSTEFLVSDKLGFVADGYIFYEVSDNTLLSISTGYHEWSERFGPGGNEFRAIPIFGGIRIPITKGFLTPYVSGEFGLQFITRNYTFEVYERTERGLFRLVSSEPATEYVTKFTFRFAFGTTINIYKNLGFDFSLRYSPIRYDYIYIYPTQMSRGSLNLYDFVFGIYYKI